MRFPPLPSPRDVVHLYKLQARKQLSQNFLLDMNLNRKIVNKAGKLAGCYVCEVGPGPGGITRAILEQGVEELIVIEKDPRFMPGLQLLAEAAKGIECGHANRMRIFQGDILRFNMENLFPQELKKDWKDDTPDIHIIGNLPFNVSTPLIIRWLEAISTQTGAWRYGRTPLTLTFQKEVAERMVASVLSKERCRLSIMCQYLCDVSLKFEIPGKAFVPPPEVDVGVVKFIPLKRPLIELPFPLVEKVVSHIFHTKRKLVKNCVPTLFPPNRPELTARMFEEADVSPDILARRLSVEEVGRLCHVYNKICQENPGIYEYNFRDPEYIELYRKRRSIELAKIEDQILHGEENT
ncbi:hypothetical protein ACJMK2_040597 [Sinanodonta woodiana]|uniref:rRNA adenine N(6)-methyltransferase n=1 Tax=Sinanodonta woodiana TaxID=1069815 RepID=A0ABD3W1J8_SINWO